jgi:chemotaxis protein MotB
MLDINKLRLGMAIVVLLSLPGCVSKSTFENMADQARSLDTNLSDLKSRHQALLNQQNDLQAEHSDLQNRQADLQARHEVLASEKIQLEKDNSELLAQKEALTAGNKELEEILAAREDSLSKKIADQRQEMVRQETNCSSQLAAQTKQIGDRDKQISEQAEKIAAISADNARLTEELRLIRAQKEAEVQQMTSTYQSLIDKMKGEIDKGQITISELKGKLTVNLIDAILFDSGKAEVKPEGLLVLQKVIDILKEVTGKTIRIEGHTDNVRIGGVLAQKYPTNWELSAARAVNVARFLQERGIDPLNLNAVAYGEYKPVAANDDDAGRAQNRRIEIILADKE